MELILLGSLKTFLLLLIALSRDTLGGYVTADQSVSCRRYLVAGYHDGYSCSITPTSQPPVVLPLYNLALPDGVQALQLTFTHDVKWGISLDNTTSLTKLRILEVDVTKVSILPSGAFPYLPSLQHLQLQQAAKSGDRSFSLDLQSGAFNGLSRLQRLILSDLRLTHLNPGVFQGLESLIYLDLGNNHLEGILSGVLDPVSSKLEALVLSRNWVSSLSRLSLGNCVSLSKLDLYANRLSEIRRGDIVNFAALRELNLADNYIQRIDDGALDGLNQLETLDISGNKINLLGNEILPKRPNNLKYLYLNKNGLENLQADFFNNAVHLKILSLKSNKISIFPVGLFSKMYFLEELDLSGNLLNSLETEQFRFSSGPLENQNLKRLFLSDNHLDLITPGVFTYLMKLEDVDLSNNQLRTFPESALPASITLSASTSNSSAPVLLHLSGNPWNCDCNLLWISRFITGDHPRIQLQDEIRCSSPEMFTGKYVTTSITVDYCNSLLSTTGGPGAMTPASLREDQPGEIPLNPTQKTMGEPSTKKPEYKSPVNKTIIAVSIGILAICIVILVIAMIVRLMGKKRKRKKYSVDGDTLPKPNAGHRHSEVAQNDVENQLDLQTFTLTKK